MSPSLNTIWKNKIALNKFKQAQILTEGKITWKVERQQNKKTVNWIKQYFFKVFFSLLEK
jgi:hypothetical protein